MRLRAAGWPTAQRSVQSGGQPRARTRSGQSAWQLTASALAAASGAMAASSLGVAGTIGGAALTSVVATAGTTVYERALHRTRDGLAAVTPRGWRRLAIATVLVFGLAIGTLSVAELVLGRSVSDVVRGVPGHSAPSIVQLTGPPPSGGQTSRHHSTPSPAPASRAPASAAIPVPTTANPPHSTPSAVPTDTAAPTPSRSSADTSPPPTTTSANGLNGPR